jgi:hypothetical protein
MKGENNVPFGRYSNPKIVDEINLWRCSNFLQDVKVMNGDFECIKSLIDQDSFVYLDPPYIPLSSTSNFTSYTEQGFDIDMQFTLKYQTLWLQKLRQLFAPRHFPFDSLYYLAFLIPKYVLAVQEKKYQNNLAKEIRVFSLVDFLTWANKTF